MKSLYIVSDDVSRANVTCFFDAGWTPELPLFDIGVQSPALDEFSKKYTVMADVHELGADIWVNGYLASDDFLELCKKFNLEYISISAEIILNGGAKPTKNYFFFCVVTRKSILDQEKSSYTLMDEGLLRPSSERSDLPVYEKIETFVALEDIEYDFFYCEEIRSFVCSQDFKQAYNVKGLSGLGFKPIDENYTYAPFEDFFSD